MKTLLALATCLALVSCGGISTTNVGNPLNTPGDEANVQYLASDIHSRTFASDYGH